MPTSYKINFIKENELINQNTKYSRVGCEWLTDYVHSELQYRMHYAPLLQK